MKTHDIPANSETYFVSPKSITPEWFRKKAIGAD